MTSRNKIKIVALFLLTAFACSTAFTQADDNTKPKTKKELKNLANGNKTPGQVFDGQKYTPPVQPKVSTNTVTAAQIAKQQSKIPASQPPKMNGPSINHINVPSPVVQKQTQTNTVTTKATQPKKTTP